MFFCFAGAGAWANTSDGRNREIAAIREMKQPLIKGVDVILVFSWTMDFLFAPLARR
jgi:hypothetical protein